MSLRPKTVDFDETWGRVRESVEATLTLSDLEKASWMDTYNDVYNLCTAHPQPFAERTYNALKEFLQDHVNTVRETIMAADADLLVVYREAWGTFSIGSAVAGALFRYLNDNWIRRRTEETRGSLGGVYHGGARSAEQVYEIKILAYVIWRDTLLSAVKERLVHRIMEVIERDRDAELVDRKLVADIVASFVKLGLNKNKPLEVYRDDFEVPYIAATNEYYLRESTAFIAASSCSDYMRKAEARLEEEESRAQAYLDSSSYERVKKEMETVLIARNIGMLQDECEPMIREERIGDLARMFGLLRRIQDGIAPMLEVLERYVTETGLSKMAEMGKKALSKPRTYVEAMLELHATYRALVEDAFRSDSKFLAALDRAMRNVINDTSVFKVCKSPELLAKFCDVLLKKSKSNLEESELDARLGDVITVFTYVDDKDVFQKFYSKMLAKRLINRASVSDDAESSMLSRLKHACGYEYTSKLQRMFTDMHLSADINAQFRETNASLESDIDFSIQVLTAGSWPMHASTATFAVPRDLERLMNRFETYYHVAHQGRKLSWLHQLSKGELKTNYMRKDDKELSVTCYQMAVLLLFNDAETITLAELTSGTALKPKTLLRTASSLVEYKLLTCEVKAKDLMASLEAEDSLPDDLQFDLNFNFKNKRHRLKVTATVTRETKKENKEAHDEVSEDRKLFLQAAIVRIMKARRQLKHSLLVAETAEQARARFKPSVSLIKKCIEHLIDKGYLERVEGQKGIYRYLA